MKNITYLLFIFFTVMSLFIGCASQRPVLYPNEQLNKVGQTVAKQDIENCLQLSSTAGLKTKTGKDITRKTTIGAATGAAVGAASGAISGHAGRGSAIGAASGASSGFMWGLFNASEVDPTQKRYVEECLREKGYKIIGWQ